MFKSGFIIFLISNKGLIQSKDHESLPILYKKIFINNKINLIQNTYNIFNMNSLRFIMIKLGIIYKEFYLIEKGMENLKNFDLKTAHLLMQYIVETSDLPYIVNNRNDNFYIYLIRTAINYIINLFKQRTQKLKKNEKFKRTKFLKNTKFLNYFKEYKDFRELVILSKYLDVLRKIDNEIYYDRKLFSDSLNVKIKNLNILIKDKNIENQDIDYFKSQLYYGKVSDTQNYIIKKISKLLDNDISINLNILQKMIAELYCYNILIQADRSCSLPINILRNISFNPNLFFKNIAMKTRFKSLRNFLLSHLKYSNFCLHSINKYIKIMRYIDKHYSNPSFIVEYHIKSTKIIRSKEFRKIEFNKLINKTYKINGPNQTNLNSNYISNNNSNSLNHWNFIQTSSQNQLTGPNNTIMNIYGQQHTSNNSYINSSSYNKLETMAPSNGQNNEKNTNNYNHERSNSNKVRSKKKESFYEVSLNQKSVYLDVENKPLISKENITKIKNLINQNISICDNYFNSNQLQNSSHLTTQIFEKNILEIFSNYFMNNEIDDFGMKMKDFLKKPHYMTSNYYNLISKLILNYFVDHDEKIYLLNNSNESRFVDCAICKKYQISSTNESININTDTKGYSNLTLENIKYFDVSNIIRIKYDDFIQKFSESKDLIKILNFDDLCQVKSLFNYIIGHYQTNYLYVFIERLIASKFFKENFLEENIIKSQYFSKLNDNFKFFYLKSDLEEIFKFKDDSFIKEIIFRTFINYGILIENYQNVSNKIIRGLIFNNLLKIDDKSYYRYYNIKEKSNKNIIENFITKRKFISNSNDCLERLSKIDEKMDELILFSDNNHYLLQNFLDFDFLNPKYIFFKYQDKLNPWQRVILLSKYHSTNNIFEISLENISILKKIFENGISERDIVLVFFGCIIYLKQQNIDFQHYCKNLPKNILFLCEKHIPNIIKEINKSLFHVINNNNYFKDINKEIFDKFSFLKVNSKKKSDQYNNINNNNNKDKKQIIFDDKLTINLISTLGDKLKNDIFTCNNDISIKSLVNKYYKFINNNNLTEWVNRTDNNSINLDDFEILIENGRVIDAFYYYLENFEGKLSKEDIYSMVYNICLNNLLNYNIFSAASTFLLLINPANDNDNKNIIVQIEAANRIINYEINQLVNSNPGMDINLSLAKVKQKNYEFFKDKANKYFDLDLTYYEDSKNSSNLKQIINVYKKLVSEFREFNQPNNTNNQNNIFPILKKLEDATWESNQDFLLTTPKEINLESPWLLVSLFCKVHNYEMSLTLLHELGRSNSWILFLYKAQDQECPPTTVLQILEGYFSDQTLKKHLKITIQELINSQNEDNNVNKNSNNRLEDDVLSLSSKPLSNFNLNTNNIGGGISNYKSIHNGDIPNNAVGNFNNHFLSQQIISDPNKIERLEKLDKYSFNKFFTLNGNQNEKDKELINYQNKIDFSGLKTNFNDFIIYNIKQKLTKTPNTVTQIYDPIYFMTIAETSKEKGIKNINILNEAININWKDLIFVSMIFTNFDQETIFTSFTLYLYMSIKEILVTKNSLEDFLKNIFIHDSNYNKIAFGKNYNLMKNLREIFDNRKKNFKLTDLENLIKILLLNNYSQVLLEVLELFEMQFSFEEFVLFNKSFFQNDFENAFVHLFIFKNSIFEYFNERLSNNFIAKIIEEEGNINNINIEFITSEIKTFDNLILVFFYQVSNTIINNLIEMFENDCFILYKLLEILYLTKWNKRYSNYFKNMCVLEHIKNKSKSDLDYKSSFEMIVELLILENNFDILSEYINSYEENKEDDTLLYNIFSTIASFEKNYILYNDEERNQFWNSLEELLINANFSEIQIARFFLFIIETKEEKFFIREQFLLIIKCYKYFIQYIKNIKSNISPSLHNPEININLNIKKSRDDRLSKFMKSVIGYEIDKIKNLTEDDIIEDLKNKIFIIVFSNCELEKLKILFRENNYFTLEYIIVINEKIIEELREEFPAINFGINSNNFWNKLQGVHWKNSNKSENSELSVPQIDQEESSFKEKGKNYPKEIQEIRKISNESNNYNYSQSTTQLNNNFHTNIIPLNKNPYVHINNIPNSNGRSINNNHSNKENHLINHQNIYTVPENLNPNLINSYNQSHLISNFDKQNNHPSLTNNNNLKNVKNNLNNLTIKENSENPNNINNLLISFNDSFKKACLNLINLNKLQICLSLSLFYNLSNDELEKFDNFIKFVIKYFEELKKIPYNDLNSILNKAFNKSLENVTHFIKTLQYDIKETLISHLNNCLNYKSLENIMLLTILKILISVGINLDINEFLNFDEKIELILYRLIDSNLDSKNIFNHFNRLFDNDELLAKTIIEKFIFYKRKSNLSSSAVESQKFLLFKYVKYFKTPFKFGIVIKNNLIEALHKIQNIRDFDDLFLELLILGYYSFLRDCFHKELGQFNHIIKNSIDQNEFFFNMSNLFKICEDDERVKEIFYCINHIIFKNDLDKLNLNYSNNDFSSILNIQIKEFRQKTKKILTINNKNLLNGMLSNNIVCNTSNIYGMFKAEIEFYNRIKNFKKLGNIYVKLANEYAKSVEERNRIEIKLKRNITHNSEIIKKEQELTILNLYLRAAQQFLLDNCIVNYSKVFNKINELIIQKFSDDIDINLE